MVQQNRRRGLAVEMGSNERRVAGFIWWRCYAHAVTGRDKTRSYGVIPNMRRAFTLLLVLALACLTLAAGQVRKVKPGDVVTVQCDEEATLNKQYTIDKSGF